MKRQCAGNLRRSSSPHFWGLRSEPVSWRMFVGSSAASIARSIRRSTADRPRTAPRIARSPNPLRSAPKGGANAKLTIVPLWGSEPTPNARCAQSSRNHCRRLTSSRASGLTLCLCRATPRCRCKRRLTGRTDDGAETSDCLPGPPTGRDPLGGRHATPVRVPCAGPGRPRRRSERSAARALARCRCGPRGEIPPPTPQYAPCSTEDVRRCWRWRARRRQASATRPRRS